MIHKEVTMHKALPDPGRNGGDTCSYSPSRCPSALSASCMCCLSGISDPSGFAGCFPMSPSLDQTLAAFGRVLPFFVAFSHTGGKIPYHQRTTDGRQSRKFNRNTNWKKPPSISIYYTKSLLAEELIITSVYYWHRNVFLQTPPWRHGTHTMCSLIILSLPSLDNTLFCRASSALHSSTVTRNLLFCTSIFKWIKWYGASVWRSYTPTGAIKKHRDKTLLPLLPCKFATNK